MDQLLQATGLAHLRCGPGVPASRYQDEQEGGCEPGTIIIPANGCGNGYAVPNAVGRVITAGVQIDHPTGFFGSLRLRSSGQDPLDVNATSWLGDTNIVNLGTGSHNDKVKLEIDVFNLLDAQPTTSRIGISTESVTP